MKKGIIYVIGLFPLLIGISAFAEDTEELTEEIIEEIEVPEYEVSDALTKAEEIIKSIDKSVLPLKTMDLENETENEGTNIGNNYYIVDNDYSQINERLDQIDNKLSSLSLLGDDFNKIYIEPIQYSNSLINSSGWISYSGNSVFAYPIPHDTTIYCDFSGSDNLRSAFSNDLGVGSQIYSYVGSSIHVWETYSYDYLILSNRANDSSVFSVYYIGSSEPEEPEEPDDSIVPDSNILDALNSIKAELVKINKYNDTKLYSSVDEFKDAPFYMNKYQYETYKLLKYLVILLTCVNGLILVYIFGGRKRGNT